MQKRLTQQGREEANTKKLFREMERSSGKKKLLGEKGE